VPEPPILSFARSGTTDYSRQMSMTDSLFAALRLKPKDRKKVAAATGIPEEMLKYWERHCLLPSRDDLRKLCEFAGVSSVEVQLQMSDDPLAALLSKNAAETASLVKEEPLQ